MAVEQIGAVIPATLTAEGIRKFNQQADGQGVQIVAAGMAGTPPGGEPLYFVLPLEEKKGQDGLDSQENWATNHPWPIF